MTINSRFWRTLPVNIGLFAVCLGLTPLAWADTTTIFPASTDTYNYVFYPYMYAKGDTITGNRTTTDPSISSVSYDLHVDATYLYCSAAMDFYVDNQKVATLTSAPYLEDVQFTGSKIPITASSANPHVLKIVRTSPASDDCGSVVWKEGVGSVTLHKTVTTGTDADKDGHTSTATGGDDCNDNDATIYPGATETCDGKDNDCDRTVDEGAKITFFIDRDLDKWGDATATTTQACTQPAGYSSTPGDCDDTNPQTYPEAQEWCDGSDNDCNDIVDDKDFDGDDFVQELYCGGDDCDDNNPAVNPGALEVPADGIDNDCDDLVDESSGDCSGSGGSPFQPTLLMGIFLLPIFLRRRNG